MNDDKEIYTYNEVDNIIDKNIISLTKGQLIFSLSIIVLGISSIFFVASLHALLQEVPIAYIAILYSVATFAFLFGTISTAISLILAFKYIKVRKFW